MADPGNVASDPVDWKSLVSPYFPPIDGMDWLHNQASVTLINPLKRMLYGSLLSPISTDTDRIVPGAVVGSAVGTAAGAGIGALMGKRKGRARMALLGALVGLPTGAFAGMYYEGVKHASGDAVVLEKEPMWKRPVSSTIGRWASPIMAASIGHYAPFLPSPTKEELEGYLEGYRDSPAYKDFPLEVYPGGTHPLHNLSRTWKNPHIGLVGKLMGTLTGPTSDLFMAASRGDFYNPFAHSATVYTNLPELVAHEAGHAQYFGKSDIPSLEMFAATPAVGVLSLPLNMRQELAASANGIKLIRKMRMKKALRQEIETRANRILSGAAGTYVGGGLLGGTIVGQVPAALIGQAVGAATQPFSRYVDSTEKKGEHMQTKEASLRGFVDRCAAVGMNPDVMLKYASILDEALAQAKANPEIAGAGSGALLGGAVGAMAGGKNRARNAFLGMLGGGAVGAGVGTAMDPRMQQYASALMAKLKAGKGGGKATSEKKAPVKPNTTNETVLAIDAAPKGEKQTQLK